MLKKLRLALEACMLLTLLYSGYALTQEHQALLDAQSAYGQLEDELKAKITFRDNQLEILKRENGKVSVNTYIYRQKAGGL